MTPGEPRGPLIVTFLRRMLRKVETPALHVAKGASGQQSEHLGLGLGLGLVRVRVRV